MRLRVALIVTLFVVAFAGSATARQSVGRQRQAPAARLVTPVAFVPAAIARAASPAAQNTSALQFTTLHLDIDLVHRRPQQGWDRQDDAHSLWRRGSSAMDDGQFRLAAESFGKIHERYPRSTYAPESYYWEAFSLYRLESEKDLRKAVSVLDAQQRLHPLTPTAADGIVLATRLRGELARGGDQTARRELAMLLHNTDECSRSGVSVKIAALSAFRQLDPAMTLRYLQNVFRTQTPCAGYLRQQSVFLLAQVHSRGASELLIELAKNSRELDVRNEAVQWLSDVRDERSVEILEDILLGASPFSLKQTAFFSLTQLATSSDATVFQKISSSRHTQVSLRVKAISWLAEQRLHSQSNWILGLYREDNNPAIREAVVHAIAGQHNLADRAWLLEVGKDTTASLSIRKAAISAAAELHAPSSDLYSLYHQVEAHPLRAAIIDLFGRNSREKSAVERLIDIAVLDADSTLRASSLRWLRQSKDPRAVEFLIAYREKH